MLALAEIGVIAVEAAAPPGAPGDLIERASTYCRSVVPTPRYVEHVDGYATDQCQIGGMYGCVDDLIAGYRFVELFSPRNGATSDALPLGAYRLELLKSPNAACDAYTQINRRRVSVFDKMQEDTLKPRGECVGLTPIPALTAKYVYTDSGVSGKWDQLAYQYTSLEIRDRKSDSLVTQVWRGFFIRDPEGPIILCKDDPEMWRSGIRWIAIPPKVFAPKK